MARTRRKTRNRKRAKARLENKTTAIKNSAGAAEDQPKHPLADSWETTKYKVFLYPIPSVLFVLLYYWLTTSEAPISDLIHLYEDHGLELALDVIGTIFVLTDVLGTERLKKLDQIIFQTMSSGARKIFLKGAIERACSYLQTYKGPGFWYERDVFVSFFIVGGILQLGGRNIFHGRQLHEILLPVFIWALGTHSMYRNFISNHGLAYILSRYVFFPLMACSTLPLTVARLLIYLETYIIYFPFDIVSTLSVKMKLEGQLKIIGGVIIIASSILTYLHN